MHSFAFVTAALLGAANALPTVGSFRTKATFYDARFDDLSPLPLVDLTPIGDYKALYYQGMDVIQLGAAGLVVAGIIPKSGSNVAVYDVQTETLQGEPSLLTSYDDSKTTSLDFKSFYFGCVLKSEETAASAPQSCSITVTGFRGENNAVATQKFNFVANGGLTQNMKFAKLNSKFSGLTSVTFDTAGDLSVAVTTLLDNVDYVAYTKN